MPWCPKCKSEYRDGFSKCSDCNIPLVKNLPDKVKNEELLEEISEEKRSNIRFYYFAGMFIFGLILFIIHNKYDNDLIQCCTLFLFCLYVLSGSIVSFCCNAAIFSTGKHNLSSVIRDKFSISKIIINIIIICLSIYYLISIIRDFYIINYKV